MRLTLKVWRQAGPDAPGKIETYVAPNVSPNMSFLEMLDEVNQDLIGKGEPLWTKEDPEGETHRYDIGSWPSVGWNEAFVTVRYDENGNLSDAEIDGL